MAGLEIPALVSPLRPLHTTEGWTSLLVRLHHGPLDATERSHCKGYESGCDAEGKSEWRVCGEVLCGSESKTCGPPLSVRGLWLRLVEDERRRLAAV